MNCYNFKKEAFEKNVQDICKHPIIDGAETKNFISINEQDNYLYLLDKAAQKHKVFLPKQDPNELVELRSFLNDSLVNKNNIFLTVTFKEGIQTDKGSIKYIGLQDVIRVAIYLKNKIGIVFGGRRKRINFIPCAQRNASGLWHLHIAFGGFFGATTFDELKENSFSKLRSIISGICNDHELLHGQKNVQYAYDINGLIDYNSRFGVDTWIPEATLLRSKKVYPVL